MCTMCKYENRVSKSKLQSQLNLTFLTPMTAIPPVSNLFLVSYTKSNAVRSSADSSGCQKSMITTYLSSRDLLSGR